MDGLDKGWPQQGMASTRDGLDKGRPRQGGCCEGFAWLRSSRADLQFQRFCGFQRNGQPAGNQLLRPACELQLTNDRTVGNPDCADSRDPGPRRAGRFVPVSDRPDESGFPAGSISVAVLCRYPCGLEVFRFPVHRNQPSVAAGRTGIGRPHGLLPPGKGALSA